MPRTTLEASALEVRAGLDAAMRVCRAVIVVVRGDPAQGRAVRAIEGVPVGFRATHDGRERVVLQIADGAEQLVLLERIAKVLDR